MRRASAGLTLVELLVAAALMVIVLGIVGVFFARQAGLTKTTQTQTSVQDTARAVMQLVTNDLLSAGSNQYYPSAASMVTPVPLTGAKIPVGTDGGLTDDVSLEYVSSLRPTLSGACRDVTYTMSGSTLERSDVACGSAASPSVLAKHVLAFDLVYQCSDGHTAATPADCPPNSVSSTDTYVRAVTIGLMVRSGNQTSGSAPSPSYVAPTPDYGGGGGSSVTCPAGYSCAVLTQTVQTPSLKQYPPGG